VDAFVLHSLDLLAPLGAVRARAMMGGHLLYCGEIPVGLVYDERLYLKTDAETRALFADAGCEPFTYEIRGRMTEMSYWSAPDAALDDAEAMRPWAARALEAALRAREKKGRGRGPAPFDSAAPRLRSGRTERPRSGSKSTPSVRPERSARKAGAESKGGRPNRTKPKPR
jgi:DNA transformation protein and related proteins